MTPEWTKRVEGLFRLSTEEQGAVLEDLAPEETPVIRLLVLLSYGTLSQHGLHRNRIYELVREALPKMRDDIGSLQRGVRRRHPAWVIINNRYVRYGYYEYDAADLVEWDTINPTHKKPTYEEISMPIILTVYNLLLLRHWMSQSSIS